MIVYISIGNSDDKLTQSEWSQFVGYVSDELSNHRWHGEWYSRSDSQYQNACWCVEVGPDWIDELKERLIKIRKDFQQDSIAWAVAATSFI